MHFPLRVFRYEIREDNCGAGRWRGGAGSIREIMFMTDGHASIEGDGHKHLPWGLFGGADGAAGNLILNPDSPEQRELPSMIRNLTLRKEIRFALSACVAEDTATRWNASPHRSSKTSWMD